MIGFPVTVKLKKSRPRVCVPDPDAVVANRDKISIWRIGELMANRTGKCRVLQFRNQEKLSSPAF